MIFLWLECYSTCLVLLFQSISRSDTRECLDVRRASGFGGCCSGLVDILLRCVSPPLNPEQKHVDLCCAAVRSDKSRIGMRAVCRVTLDTASPSLESECERVTAEKWTFNAKQNRVCLKVYVFIWKNVEFLFFVFRPNFVFVYSGLTKVKSDFLLSFFLHRAHTCMWVNENSRLSISTRLVLDFHILIIAEALSLYCNALQIRLRGKQTLFLITCFSSFLSTKLPF